MSSINLKSFLEFKVIYEDNDLIELNIKASNNDFSGSTQVYTNAESLLQFSDSLVGFPRDNKVLFFDAGERNSYSYFSMRFYSIDQGGLVGVEIYIESNSSANERPEKKGNLKAEVIVEPSAIDNFQRELKHLAINQNGSAILFGRDNRLDN